MNNSGIVIESEWVGLSLTEAAEKAESQGWEYRVVENNGRQHMVTHDLKNKRLNFRVNDNLITDLYGG